jgi:superfamily I DNA and/or RNA helicase
MEVCNGVVTQNGEKYLLLLKNNAKSNVVGIRSINDVKYSVDFINPAKTYTYLKENVKFISLDRSLTITDELVVILGNIQANVVSIDYFGDWCRVLLNSSDSLFYQCSEVVVYDNALGKTDISEKINYFKEVAGLYDSEDDKKISESLTYYYSNFNFIHKDSILKEYLTGELDNKKNDLSDSLIFPFGFNSSQQQAVANGLTYKASVIEGPPGTGKTQTILNLIANFVVQSKTVAVVSNNNSAIDNVKEKLQRSGLDFIIARLGSGKDKIQFLDDQPVLPEELERWKLDDAGQKCIAAELSNLKKSIVDIFHNQNELARLKDLLKVFKLEQTYFQDFLRYYYNEAPTLFLRNSVKSSYLLNLWHKCEKKNGHFSFLDKFVAFILSGTRLSVFDGIKLPRVIFLIQSAYYDKKILELELKVTSIENFLKHNNGETTIVTYRELSMRYFKGFLSDKYSTHKRMNYQKADLRRHSYEFVKEYPVVLSTTFSLVNCLAKEFLYDYVIIDEASQADLRTFVLALSCAKNAIIVGDTKQLPNVITKKIKAADQPIFSKYNISENYKFSGASALSSVLQIFPNEIPRITLKEHYRCHPDIIGFCNQMYYNNELIVLSKKLGKERNPLAVYYTVPGNHARDNFSQREIDVTLSEVIPKENLDVCNGSLGIISPFKKQVCSFKEFFKDTAVEIGTVDKFQGREKQIIILSTVDNKIGDFVSDPRRLNVAVSRAVSQFILVTNGNHNNKHTGIDELADYMRYRKGIFTDSKIRSIFDNLYTEYYNYVAKPISSTSFKSENLMMELIREVMNENGYANLGVQFNYPLSQLCKDFNFNEDQRNYLHNENTRVDFVIYFTTSKLPLLAIEVDGYSFHDSGTVGANKQKARDHLKDQILKIAGIPIERFSTVGSREKERLKSKLNLLLDST